MDNFYITRSHSDLVRMVNTCETKIELTNEEMEKVYRFVDCKYRVADIKDKILGMICEEENLDLGTLIDELPLPVNPTKKSLALRKLFKEPESVYEQVEDALSNNDSYWESFWLSLEYAINEETSKM